MADQLRIASTNSDPAALTRPPPAGGLRATLWGWLRRKLRYEGLLVPGLLGHLNLRQRIIALFVILIVISGVTALSVLGIVGTGIARDQITADLETADRIFLRQLDSNQDRLAQATRLLSADFGFREAIATQDGPTLQSALRNHGERIDADLVLLSDNEGHLLAGEQITAMHNAAEELEAVVELPGNRPFPFPDLLAAAHGASRIASGIVSMDGRAYQLVVVPVLAPTPIAWVAMGFLINDRWAGDLKSVTALDVSFLAAEQTKAPRTSQQEPKTQWTLLGSSLNPDQQTDLTTWLTQTGTSRVSETTLMLGNEAFQTRVRKIASSEETPIVAVLQRSMDQAMAPFERLMHVLIGLVIAGVVLSVVLAYIFTDTITRPLAQLTNSARRIRDGHYDEPVLQRSGDEIGVLADSLNHMREGIATREAEILRLAYQDKLTGLPNRLGFQDALRTIVDEARSQNHAVAVMVLNLDRFRHINTTLDFSVGDEVLCHVAARLRAQLPPTIAVARLGGDEFGVVAPLGAIGNVDAVVKKLLHCFELPVLARGQSLDVAASIGIAEFPADGGDADILARNADLACRTAKQHHAEQARFDRATMSTKQAHLTLLGELRQAIEHDELRLLYQPKIDLRTNQVAGVEALVRWQHPERGFVSPADFIPFAEQTGYIRSITRWVLNAALRDCRHWHDLGFTFPVSVNLSTRDLLDSEIVAFVQQLLKRHGLAPERVCLEITESGFMEDPELALRTLHAIDGLGVKLSIDDYGTGYSSLSYVKKLPVDELKIDRAFIKDMVTDQRDRAIVRSTIQMAHNLGLTVTAEGVEDRAGIDQLLGMECDCIQGFVYSRPVALPALLDWIRDSGRSTTAPEPLTCEPPAR